VTPSRETWLHELQAMEDHLKAHRAALENRDVQPPAPRQPRSAAELGPLPDDLRTRVEEILIATRALEGTVAEARGALAVSMRQAERRARRSSSYLDTRV
jgi:hypothetical protein